MAKLIGYAVMKNKHGKVLYCASESNVDFAKGMIPFEKPIFVYDDVAESIDESCIGKDIKVSRGVTFN